MVIRVAVGETEGSERLVEEFASLFGDSRVRLLSSGRIELELSGEANEALNHALTAIERTLEGAGVTTAKVWVGEHAYMLERPVFEQPTATPARQFVARSLGRDRSEEMSRPSSGTPFIRRVNNSAYEVFVKLGYEDGEFWCECNDLNCEERVTLTLREYAALKKRVDEPLLSHSHTARRAASEGESARV